MNESVSLSIGALAISGLSILISILLGTRSRKLAAYDHSTQLFLEIDHAFMTYPDLRPYFYDYRDLDDATADEDRIRAVAELMLDIFEWVLRHEYELGGKESEGWRDYFKDCFETSPILRSFQDTNPSWHPRVGRFLKQI